jgi:hypothetical protein
LIKNYLDSTTLAKTLTADGLILPPDAEFETPLGKLSWSEQKIAIRMSGGHFGDHDILIWRANIDPGLVLFIQNHLDYDKLEEVFGQRAPKHNIYGSLSDIFYVGIDRYDINYMHFCPHSQARLNLDLLLEEFGRLNEPIIY